MSWPLAQDTDFFEKTFAERNVGINVFYEVAVLTEIRDVREPSDCS